MELSTKYATSLQAESNGNHPDAALRHAGVLGVGSCVPAKVLTNADLETIVDTSHDWIFSRTGIVERRIVAPDESLTDLASEAGRRALADAGIAAGELDLIIVATVTRESPFPATASLVQAALGATGAAAFDLGAACSGFIYGLATAAQFVRTGLCRNVLVIGAEALSRFVNWEDRTTCVLFGDGAGAAVVGVVPEGEGLLSVELGSDGTGGDLLAVAPGGKGHPLTTGSDEPRPQSIRMAGQEVFKFAVRVVEESSRRLLERAGITVDEIDLFVPHQANIRIIDAAVKRLGFRDDQVFSNVERYGNTSAASIPIALDEARKAGRIRPGDLVLMVGFGAGLTWASALVRWSGSKAPINGNGHDHA